MGAFYRTQSNNSALYLPEMHACYRTYYSYNPNAVLQDKDGERGFRARWASDFEQISKLLMEPPLAYINEVNFLGGIDEDFAYTRLDNTYYSRQPLSAELQQRYVDELPEAIFELQIHSMDYFSWRNEFEVHGRTRDDKSVHMVVQVPEHQFYVWGHELASSDIGHLNSMVSALLEEKAASEGRIDQAVWARLELVDKRNYMGYHPTKKPYIRVTHSHSTHKYRIKEMFEEMWSKPKFYESFYKPVFSFLLDRNAYTFGWMITSTGASMAISEERRSHCDIEFTVNYTDVFGMSPATGEAGDPRYEALASYRIVSLDAEMLNPDEAGFPIADQNPIVSICSYSQRYNQGNVKLEVTRDPKDDTRVRQTGRSNYDDAMAFCVASVDAIDSTRFDEIALPNPPKANAGVPVFRRGIGRKTGKYKKDYITLIRRWNDFIARFAEWERYVGSKRSSVVFYNQELIVAIHALRQRPDGLSGDVWEKEQCLEWEHTVGYIVQHYDARYTGDIGQLSTLASNDPEEAHWMQMAAEAQAEAQSTLETEEDRLAFHGEIEHNWSLFHCRKKVFCYESEAAMIRGFRDYIVEYDPDVLTGYNVENFDLSFIIRRIELLDIRDETTGKLLSLGRVKSREDSVATKTATTRAHGERNFSEVRIAGRDVLDMLNVFNNDVYGKMGSYTLANVAEVKLGDTKHDVPHSAIPSLFRNNRERLNDYCLKDGELVLMLMNKLSTVNFLIAYAQLVGTITVGRLNVEGMQAKVFSGVARFMRKEGLDKIYPDVNYYSAGHAPCGLEDDGSYTGAWVFEPKCGLIVKLVWVVDFSGMYPNIMRDKNVGHDVMGVKAMWDKLGIDCTNPDICYRTKKEYLNPKTGAQEYYYILIPRRFFANEFEANNLTLDDCYASKKKALNPITELEEHFYTPKIDISTICGSLTEGIDGRDVVKKKMGQYSPWEEMYKVFDAQQQVYKIRNNSTYGACGVSKGKLAAKAASETVTLEGRDMVMNLATDLKREYGVEITGGKNIPSRQPANCSQVTQTRCLQFFPTSQSSTRCTRSLSIPRLANVPASQTKSRALSTTACRRTPAWNWRSATGPRFTWPRNAQCTFSICTSLTRSNDAGSSTVSVPWSPKAWKHSAVIAALLHRRQSTVLANVCSALRRVEMWNVPSARLRHSPRKKSPSSTRKASSSTR